MKATSLLGHSAQLLCIIRKSPQPADQLTSSYTRERKYLGAQDRRTLSAVVFLALRMLSSTQRVVSILFSTPTPVASLPEEDALITATLVLAEQLGLERQLQPLLTNDKHDAENSPVPRLNDHARSLLIEKHALSSGDATAFIDSITQCFNGVVRSDDAAGISMKSFLPQWIVEYWQERGEKTVQEIVTLGHSLLNPAPLCIRVNTAIISRTEVLRRFREHNIPCDPSMVSPHGIIVHERVQITQTELYKSGAIEIQDEGSQLVAFALDPAEHDRVLDACAGAGGKTLHCAVIQHDKGNIMASDAEAKRMRELHTRLLKAQLRSIHIQTLHSLSDAERSKLYSSFDCVLIDAPCTGMGTTRRSPMLKHRLTKNGLDAMTHRQREIIKEYSHYVKPGGVLLYVTCSFMRAENEEVVEWFLRNNTHFEVDELASHFTKHECEVHQEIADQFSINLSPAVQGCDGFFIARLRRART